MRCIEIEKKIEKTQARLIHFDFRYYSDDLDPILDWVRIAENLNDPLLMRQDLSHPSHLSTAAIQKEEEQ